MGNTKPCFTFSPSKGSVLVLYSAGPKGIAFSLCSLWQELPPRLEFVSGLRGHGPRLQSSPSECGPLPATGAELCRGTAIGAPSLWCILPLAWLEDGLLRDQFPSSLNQPGSRTGRLASHSWEKLPENRNPMVSHPEGWCGFWALR